ncbi:MAG: biotin transporter BioY [Synechococcus sp. SB0668_bin_15]|nr:biotin transporter BioY [Synechococcus sp. SB0668_bin_15]MXZ82724.1 biotin transporter BioY [Synechococcus sp. SB0666_bin_14]MYC49841.1 biotin transporter BioY [Synechococcus sp. SB0662_bin_14]MYG47449.1 biotin transporter BioY [Synechococcus sp. SB0675_bin_6]MYJ60295.1 biotin transporter BioY [Synechococcus sp. SB0672_bin_6]MYK91722.1 biotin transporter BioY [Synechococcus sp. SB0669_bin_8]
MTALTNLVAVVMGLLLTIVVGFLQPTIAVPAFGGLSLVELPTSGQLAAVLLTALLCGARVGLMTAVAYLAFGLTQFPVFHAGGGLDYVLEPGFGYLLGLMPGAWLVGRIGQQVSLRDPFSLWFVAMVGVVVVSLVGGMHLLLGAVVGHWSLSWLELTIGHWLIPLLLQAVMACPVAVVAAVLRRFLLY